MVWLTTVLVALSPAQPGITAPELKELQFLPWNADTMFKTSVLDFRKRTNYACIFKEDSDTPYRLLNSARLNARFNGESIRLRAQFGNVEYFVDRYGVVLHEGKTRKLGVKEFRQLREYLFSMTPMTDPGKDSDFVKRDDGLSK